MVFSVTYNDENDKIKDKTLLQINCFVKLYLCNCAPFQIYINNFSQQVIENEIILSYLRTANKFRTECVSTINKNVQSFHVTHHSAF